MTYARVAILLMGAFGAMGCTTTCDDWAIHPDFSDEDRADIVRATERWNAFARREVLRPVIEDRDTCVVTPHAPYGMPTNTVGRTHKPQMVIEINMKLLHSGHMQPVVMHEFGHALGLEHVVSGIMSWREDQQTPDFSPDDLAECMKKAVCL